MSIKLKMVLGFLSVLLIFALSSGFVFFQFNKSQSQVNELADNSVPSLEIISQMDNDVLNVSRYGYSFLLASNDSEMNEQEKNIENRLKKFDEHSKLYEPLISSAEERNVYLQFKEKWTLYQQQLTQLKAAYRNHDYENGKKLLPSIRSLFNEADVLMQELVKINVTMAHAAAGRSNEAVSLSKMILTVSVIVSILLGMVIATLITLSIIRPIRALEEKLQVLIERGGDLTHRIEIQTKDEVAELALIVNAFLENMHEIVFRTSNISEQLAASSQELNASAEQSAQASQQVAVAITEVAQGASKQAQAAGETSAIVEQMSAGTQQVAVNIQEVAKATEKASQAAQEGGKAITKVVHQMSSIEATSQETATAIEVLNDSSNEIGQIVEAISNIAKQTNLLSLNAAIEAARAGEAGRGFAVVAEEIRKLAESSQGSAKKISDLISVIQQDTEKAVGRMRLDVEEIRVGNQVVSMAGETFHQIQELVNKVTVEVQDIAATIQQLATGSQHIVTSVQTINAVAKESAAHTQTVSAATEEQSASMQEIASASQNLAQLASNLREVVSKFTV